MADEFFIHPTAVVDQPCRIGKGTKIWHFAHVCAHAQIGERCVLGQNVFVGSHVTIGNNCKIQNNVAVYEKVTLEDDVFCGPSMVFTNVMNPRSAFPRDRETGFLPTRVKRGATLGANCTIVCGTTIGEHAFIGAGSVVTKDVPAYAVVYGVPARQHGWMCECGERLEFVNGRARCDKQGTEYALENGVVKRLERG
ncbi:MAG TPA: acyltransferase [Planctomycetota bacterium]|nr:acyltransferase [Planctomycetota bacterium]HRR80372.1 acyltransferase [Planctomycetota bacterium]HRT96864.1 acyltransferase [Planctomycetota bacterium]